MTEPAAVGFADLAGKIASLAGQRGSAFHPHSAAAKGGVIAFTRSLAREAIRHHVWVNAVLPRRIATELLPGAPDQRKYAQWMADTPTRRLGTAEETAAAVAELLFTKKFESEMFAWLQMKVSSSISSITRRRRRCLLRNWLS